MSAAAPLPAVPLYGYQRRWLMDQSRFKAAKFARQTGKTFTTTLEVVDDCFSHVLRQSRARWVILSRGERQAKEAMEEGVKCHAKAYQMAFEAHEFDWRGDQGAYRALEVELPHGSRITALPANPDTARGFSANVFLDEFAFHHDSRAIWGALFPVISKPGLKLRVTSTPNGKGNKFYEIMSGQDDVWSRHVVTIHDAVRDGLPRDVEELRRGLGDEDLWKQEYELEWLDEASSWLSYDLIFSCEDDAAGLPDLYRDGVCFVGMDIGRRSDLTVITVLEMVGDVLWLREMVEMKRTSFEAQLAELARVMRHYRVGRACMDQTGMGEKLVEDAVRAHGERVEGVLFTGPAKLVMATAGKTRFEDRRIRIPAGNAGLRADLHKLRKIASATGAPRFVAERDDDHADRTWSIFLAIHAAGGERIAYRGYQSVPVATGAPGRLFEGAGDGLLPDFRGGL